MTLIKSQNTLFTLSPDFADVSTYETFQIWALLPASDLDICLLDSSKSHLFPTSTKGKVSSPFGKIWK